MQSAYLLRDGEGHTVVGLTELKDFIVCSWFLRLELRIRQRELTSSEECSVFIREAA